MAKKALIEKQQRTPKFKVRGYTRCTKCGQETFSKMLTAAGFQSVAAIDARKDLNAYAKLGVRSRAQAVAVLAGVETDLGGGA